MPPGITPRRESTRGKGFRTSQRGALHPVESSSQDMPSLPWSPSPVFLSGPAATAGPSLSGHPRSRCQPGAFLVAPVGDHGGKHHLSLRSAPAPVRNFCRSSSRTLMSHLQQREGLAGSEGVLGKRKSKKSASWGLTVEGAFRIFALPPTERVAPRAESRSKGLTAGNRRPKIDSPTRDRGSLKTGSRQNDGPPSHGLQGQATDSMYESKALS